MVRSILVLPVLLFSALAAIVDSVPAIAQTGKLLYERKCGRCHSAFDPDEYSAEEWPGAVRSMRAQAALTQSEYDEIVKYLTDASAEREESPGKSRPVLGGYLYTEYFQTPEKTKNYDIHYLAFYVSGWASDRIYYFGEFELEHGGTGGTNTFVEQAYLEYWFKPNVGVRIGAMLTPFNRFDEFHDPLSNYTVTRPQVSREIGVSAWKDVGVDLRGYFSLNAHSSLSFDIYSTNGLGNGSDLRGSRQYRDNNEDKAFGGRVNLMLGDIFEIGGSVYNGAWDDAGDHNLTMFGGHFMARTPVAEFYGEYAEANSENPAPTEDGEMSGFFVQASRLFRSAYRPTIRYGKLDYLDKGDAFGRNTGKGDKDLSELVLCFTYYPVQKVAFKAEYTFFMEGNRTADKDNDQIGLQAAVRF